MARKTAIHVTNAEVAAAEYRADARRDAAPVHRVPPSTRQILAALRGAMTERELLSRGRDAAYCELRGAAWSAEDRTDCAAEVVWTVLQRTGGAMPGRDDRRFSLAICRKIAQDWRRSNLARIARESAEADQAAAEYAASSAAVTDALITNPEYLRRAAAQSIGAARAAALRAAANLGLADATSAAVQAVVYQWLRDRTGEQCAAENGVTHATWKTRHSRGARMLRDFSAADLIGRLTDTTVIELALPPTEDDARPTLVVVATEDRSAPARGHGDTFTGRKIKEDAADWRDGTADGTRPTRPEDAAAARAACAVSARRPAPKSAAAARAKARRGYIIKTPRAHRAMLTDPITGHRSWNDEIPVTGRAADQAYADALRAAARAQVRPGRRERAVNPRDVPQFGTADAA